MRKLNYCMIAALALGPSLMMSLDGQDGGMSSLDNPTPSDMGEVTEQVPSFLDEDLSGVDTRMPLIREGIYKLEIKKIEKVPTKDQTGELLKITLATATDNCKSTTGDAINKGFPVFHQIYITVTEKCTADQIKKSVAQFTQAVGIKKIVPFTPFIGQLVFAKVIVEKERKDEKTGQEYSARNSIKQFFKPDEIKGKALAG